MITPPCVHVYSEFSSSTLPASFIVSIRPDCAEAGLLHISIRDASREPRFTEALQTALSVDLDIFHQSSQFANQFPSFAHFIAFLDGKMALLCSDAVQVAPLRLCSYLLFYLLLLSLFTHITSALITYDKETLLDIGHRFTNLLQDTLSPNSSWPPEILSERG